MKISHILILFMITSCLPELTQQSNSSSAISPETVLNDDEVKKKQEEKEIPTLDFPSDEEAGRNLSGTDYEDVPLGCEVFANYLVKNCSNSTAKECERTTEYLNKCLEIFDCPENKVEKVVAESDRDLDDRGPDIRGDFNLEMELLRNAGGKGADNCKSRAAMLTMCSSESHRRECEGCQYMWPTIVECAEDQSKDSCQESRLFSPQCDSVCPTFNPKV